MPGTPPNWCHAKAFRAKLKKPLPSSLSLYLLAFAIHATKLLKLSKAFYFSVYPFVEPWQHDEWLDYTNETNGWIYESLEVQANDKDWWGPKETAFGHRHEIFGGGGKTSNEPSKYMCVIELFCVRWKLIRKLTCALF